MRFTKGRTGKPGHDLSPAYRKQLLDQRQPLPSRLLIERFPIEHGGLKSRWSKGIWNLIAMFRVGAREFLLAAFAYGLREVAAEIAEKRKRRFGAPLFAHEQYRNHGRQ